MDIETFWASIDTSGGPDACWPWKCARNRLGYGRVWTTRERRAAQVAWELTNGPWPYGMFACHTCDNPPCCNPDHIFPGTQLENIQDAKEKGRLVPPPLQDFCKRGHPLADARIRATGRTCRECGNIRQRGYRAARRAA